jgi:hypothetical protein
MSEIYQYIEFILLTFLFLRTCISVCYGSQINDKNISIFLFYLVWYVHTILTWIVPNTILTFHFVHCTSPIAITGALISKTKNWKFYLFLLTIILINLTLKNRYIIVISYLFTYFFILLHINRLISSSNKNRGLVPAYGLMLSVLLMDNLIFLLGHTKVDWKDSLYIGYFINSIILIYLSSLSIIHVQFRRFLTH